MKRVFFTGLLFTLIALVNTNLFAQADVGIRVNFAGGDVTEKTESKLVINTKDGVISATVGAATEYKRVPAGNPSLKAAVAATYDEISVGDKVLVTGAVSSDKTSVPAKVVYLMTKADIAKSKADEADEWRRRGLNGKIESVDRIKKEIVVATGRLVGDSKMTVSLKEGAVIRRYPENSNRFADAEIVGLGDIYPGDSFRAIGDKGENSTFAAEQILTGSFQQTVGEVTAIDAAAGEVTITDSGTKKSSVFKFGADAVIQQFPPEMAQRLAMMQAMAASGVTPPAGAGGQGQTPPANGNASGQGNRPGGGMRGGSLEDLLAGIPKIGIADLKVGETVAVVSSKANGDQKVTAFKLVAGVDPFVKAAQMARGRGARGGQGGQSPSINIPGLDDGFGIP
ncbi:MAG: hypothetical protein KIS76_03650 [Pyrinomonadaceae bacterium]|nr:hypothetical protein [Pyrinomonadaceae bacterium]